MNSNQMWVYRMAGKSFEVGYYNPAGNFVLDCAYGFKNHALKRVHYLNGGGNEGEPPEATVVEMPIPVLNPDMNGVIRLVKDYINFVATDYYEDNDWDHYIYKAAVEAVYGKGIWEYMRGKQDQ